MPSADNRAHYRGRFAPSPTGPLHLGSLIAALASYLDAHHHGGEWLVRMEDLDPPREEPGAAARILHSLEQHGLKTAQPVLFQSSREAAYSAALARLTERGVLFACTCTRALLGPDGNCAGDCRRDPGARAAEPHALRVHVPADWAVDLVDALQGEQHVALGRTLRDFVVRRKDGLVAYQLAVAVDDADQGITHVVRGCDLLDSTPRQMYLQELLGLPRPHYCHLPVITGAAGRKLSKQNRAPALDDDRAPDNLRLALRFLGQPGPDAAMRAVGPLLRAAAEQWSLARVPAGRARPAAAIGLDH